MTFNTQNMNRRIWILALLASFVIAACGGGKGDGETPPEGDGSKLSEVEIKTNEMPDDMFNKPVDRIVSPVDFPATGLQEAGNSLPAWADEIVSRESIVIFSQEVMKNSPDDVEFQEKGRTVYTAPGDWTVFSVRFISKPSTGLFYVIGMYKSESEMYWTGFAGDSGLNITLKSATDGPVLYGLNNDQPFAVKWEGKRVSLLRPSGDS